MQGKTATHLIHGTVVDIAGRGVLLRGPSGSGKSDLALRLLDRGASLVADDQVEISVGRRGLKAKAPDRLRGYLEVRGLGVLSMPVTGSTNIALVVDLVEASDVPRLPELRYETLMGTKILLICINAFEVSAPLKIELAAKDISRIGNTGPEHMT